MVYHFNFNKDLLMDNVIHVDFTNKTVEAEDSQDNEFVIGVYLNTPLDHYLDSLRTLGLDEDDVLEVADAIDDYEIYAASDEVVRKFADGWLQNLL